MITKDPYFQIREKKILCNSLQKEYRILQISDLHMMVSYETSSEERKEKVKAQKKAWEPVRLDFAKLYGDDFGKEHLLDPQEGMEHVVSLVEEIHPDAVLFSGDMMEDYSIENLTVLRNALKRISAPWMWVVGNHETGHESDYAEYMKGDPSVQVLDVGELRLIGINNSQKKVSEGQLPRIRKLATEKVPVLVMHVPMMTEFNREKTSCFGPYFLMGTGELDEDTRNFLNYMQEEDNPFLTVLCGHVHGYNESYYRPGHLQICTSSCMVGAGTLLYFSNHG